MAGDTAAAVSWWHRFLVWLGWPEPDRLSLTLVDAIALQRHLNEHRRYMVEFDLGAGNVRALEALDLERHVELHNVELNRRGMLVKRERTWLEEIMLDGYRYAGARAIVPAVHGGTRTVEFWL